MRQSLRTEVMTSAALAAATVDSDSLVTEESFIITETHHLRQPDPKKNFLSEFVSSFRTPATPVDAQNRQPTHFRSEYVGCMDLHADPDRVSHYLDRHRDWFVRCAAPMQVEPIGDHGYILTLGRYGSFGFEVEPKIGLHLLPQQAGVYRIETIPAANEVEPKYLVDFQAALQLIDAPHASGEDASSMAFTPPLTHVEWTLDLGVTLFFPRFIHRLPAHLILNTGNCLLNQVVKNISTSLTTKVQNDFHATLS